MSKAASLMSRRLRGRIAAVSPVIGTILIVAITVVLGTVLYVLVTAVLVPPPPAPPAIAFVAGDWANGDYTASVASATNTARIDLPGVTYKVDDTFGVPYFVGKSGESQTTNGVTVWVTYIDADNDARITTSDQIKIHVDPPGVGSQAISGGILRLLFDNAEIATHSLA
jgi:flagellin-like protein